MNGGRSRQVEKALFETASNIADPEVRREFLAAACGGDVARLGRIEGWLAAQGEADDFFQEAARVRAEVSASAAVSLAGEAKQGGDFGMSGDEPGAHIGRYRLLERL